MTRQELTRNFTTKVEQERIKLKLTQEEMAKELGLSTSGYKKMISGKTEKIDMNLAYQMYKLTGIPLFVMLGCDDFKLNTAKKLLDLNLSQIQYINNIIDFEHSFKPEDNCDINDYITVFTPTGDMRDGMIWDSANIEKINIANYRKQFGNDISCGLRITSNHLHPVYNNGDILLISCQAPRNGDTGIFINKETGRVYIRKFLQRQPCLLQPVNNYGLSFEVDSNDKNDMDKWVKYGIVLTKIR